MYPPGGRPSPTVSRHAWLAPPHALRHHRRGRRGATSAWSCSPADTEPHVGHTTRPRVPSCSAAPWCGASGVSGNDGDCNARIRYEGVIYRPHNALKRDRPAGRGARRRRCRRLRRRSFRDQGRRGDGLRREERPALHRCQRLGEPIGRGSTWPRACPSLSGQQLCGETRRGSADRPASLSPCLCHCKPPVSLSAATPDARALSVDERQDFGVHRMQLAMCRRGIACLPCASQIC